VINSNLPCIKQWYLKFCAIVSLEPTPEVSLCRDSDSDDDDSDDDDSDDDDDGGRCHHAHSLRCTTLEHDGGISAMHS
jgi:hypothetical protein